MAQSNADIRVRALVESALSSLSKVEKAIGKIQRVAENIQVKAQGLDKIEAKVNKTNKALKETNRFFQNIARLIAGLNSGIASVIPTGKKLANTWFGVNESIELSLKNLQGYTREVTKLQQKLATIEKQQSRANNRRLGTIFPRATLEEEIAEQRGVVGSLKAKDPRFASELSELVRLEQALAENLQKEEMIRERLNGLQREYGRQVRKNINASRQAREASGFKEFSRDLENVIRLQKKLNDLGIIKPSGPASDLNSAEAALKRREYYDKQRLKLAKEIERTEKATAREVDRATKQKLRDEQRVTRELKKQADEQKKRISGGLTGVGFNLLFGGGLTSQVGSGIGTLLDDTGGIGGQIFGGALGQALDNLRQATINFAKAFREGGDAAGALEQALGYLNPEVSTLISNLQKSGQTARAAAVAQGELARVIGDDAAKAIRDTGEEADQTGRSLKILALQFYGAAQAASRYLQSLRGDYGKLPQVAPAVTESPTSQAFRDRIAAQERSNELLSKQVALERISQTNQLELYVAQAKVVANQQLLNDKAEIKLQLDRGEIDLAMRKLLLQEAELKNTKELERLNKLIAEMKTREAERAAREAAAEAERQARAIAQSYKNGERLVSSLQIQVAKLDGTNQLLIDQNVAYQKSLQRQDRINDLLDVEQREQATLYNQELYRLELQKASADEEKRKLGFLKEYNKEVASGVDKRLRDLNYYGVEVSRLRELTAAGEALKVGGEAVGQAWKNSFSGIAEGTQTAQEAISNFFRDIGRALIDYATTAIANYIAIGIARIFAGVGSASVAGTDWSKVGNPEIFSGGFGVDSSGLLGPAKPFAEGGYVTRPTNAVIGEGGESEYVLPASKMPEAMARYRAGKRGSDVVPGGRGSASTSDSESSTAHFTLDTVVINRVEYATVEQVREMGKTAAQQGAAGGYAKTLGSLRNSRSTRARVGMG